MIQMINIWINYTWSIHTINHTSFGEIRSVSVDPLAFPVWASPTAERDLSVRWCGVSTHGRHRDQTRLLHWQDFVLSLNYLGSPPNIYLFDCGMWDPALWPGIGPGPSCNTSAKTQPLDHQGNPWTEELGVLWSIGSQRIEHNLATKRQLEFTFIIKDYSILRYYLDHLQFQANQFEGLFFSFFADNIQANFQPHGYNPSGALPKQKPLELLQSTAPACGQVIQSGPSEIWRTEHGSRTDNFLSAKPKSRRDLT